MARNAKSKRRPKIGLALSGGSALGIAHIGAIKALQEAGIPIDCVSGTSAGAVAAACLAFDVPIRKMVELSGKVNWADISEFGHSKLGINSNAPMGNMLKETIGNVRIEDSLIPLSIMATDVDSGEKVVIRKGNLAEAIRASACLPGFFVPVKIGKRKLVDGGLVENLPLSPLKAMGADIRIGVNLGRWRKYKKTANVLDVIVNSYGILTRSQDDAIPGQAEVLIEPSLEEFGPSDYGKASELMDAGYRSAKAAVPSIRRLLDQPSGKKRVFSRFAEWLGWS